VPFAPYDETLLLEAGKRLPDDGSRHLELIAQFRLGRKSQAFRPPTSNDFMLEQALNLEVEGDRRRPIEPWELL
jgi:hypothetical protein